MYSSNDIIKKLKVPDDRIPTFKVILSNMKYDENALIEGNDFIRERGKILYTDSGLLAVKNRIKKLMQKEKLVYPKRNVKDKQE